MKRISVIFGLFLLLGVGSCGVESVETINISDENLIESGEQEASIEQKKVVAIANDSIFVSIKGMSCMINCVSSVKKELRNTDGIASIEVDFDPEREVDQAVITFDNKEIDAAKIKSIIEAINGGQYVVTDIKSLSNESPSEEAPEEKKIALESTDNSSSSMVDQIQNVARLDFELPNIFQLLNMLF